MEKHAGFTSGERYLANLAERSFLKLWSWPNVHYLHDSKQKRELCDLLAIMGNEAILFVHRQHELKSHTQPAVPWKRWYRACVKEQAAQLYGAEATFRNPNTKLFLDEKGEHPFPINIAAPTAMRIHRVLVTSGLNKAPQAYFKGGNGSLAILSTIKGDEHLDNPFVIGIVEESKPYIHVLDDFSLEVLFRELDTFRDFADYLTAKESLIKDNGLVQAGGEEELLAYYLCTLEEKDSHTFYPDNHTPRKDDKVIISSGWWKTLQDNPSYRARQTLNIVSYKWDELLNHLSTSYRINNNGKYESQDLKIARIMASKSRLARREIMREFHEIVDKTAPDEMRVFSSVTYKPEHDLDAFYVILQFPKIGFANNVEYREARQTLLSAHLFRAKARAPECKAFVGIAMEPPKHSPSLTFDFALLCPGDLSEEQKRIAKEAEQTAVRVLEKFGAERRRFEAIEPFDYPLIDYASGKLFRGVSHSFEKVSALLARAKLWLPKSEEHS